MFKLKPLFKAIGELPPERRVNIYAVLMLAGVVYFLWNIDRSDQKENKSDLRKEMSDVKSECKEEKKMLEAKVYRLETKLDSLIQKELEKAEKVRNDKTETVEQLKALIKKQKEILKR